MLQKLYKLASYIPADQYQRDPLNLTKDYQGTHIVFMCFDFQNDQWYYKDTILEEYNNKKDRKYLLSRISANDTPIFPAFKYNIQNKNQVNIDIKTFTPLKKISKSLEEYPELHGISLHFLQTEELQTDLINILSKQKPPGVFISIKLNSLYIGDTTYFKNKIDHLKSMKYNLNYFTYDKKKYEGAAGNQCSLTRASASKVWGYASPFAFYACKTEYGGISSGFDPTQAWKNFPVSPEASLQLERAAEFVNDNLSFRFGGYDYFLIPEKIGHGDGEEFLEFIQDFQKIGLGKSGRDNAQVEMDVLSILQEQNNSGNFSFYFYKKNKAEFKLLVSINDVFPSRIRQIIQAAEFAESLPCFKGLPRKTKGEFYNLRFTFQSLKLFLPDNKHEGSFRHGFLSVLRNIFFNQHVSRHYIFKHIMKTLRKAFVQNARLSQKDLSLDNYVRHAYMLLRFLQHLNLIQQDTNPVFSRKPTMTSFDTKFFEKHAPFFDQPPHLAALKKALFLEGVLCKKLLNYQYRQKGATPFRSRLNGLKLNERIIRRIYHEMIEKLDQYGINHYYANLETAISRYFLEARFELADDEYAFYFVMGMTLAKDVYSADEEQEEEAP